MIIAAKTRAELREVKDALKSAFKMKELSDAKFILEMGIDHDKKAGTFIIKQSRFTDDVTQQFCQQNAKSTNNSCASKFKLSKGNRQE